VRDLDESPLALEYCAQHLVDTANKLRRFAPDGSWHYKTLEFGAKFLREYDAIVKHLDDRDAEFSKLGAIQKTDPELYPCLDKIQNLEGEIASRDAEIRRLKYESEAANSLGDARIRNIERELTREREICGVLRAALKCNETFHRLGGIDDCEPCKALAQEQEMRK
jgi:hypothetical protein